MDHSSKNRVEGSERMSLIRGIRAGYPSGGIRAEGFERRDPSVGNRAEGSERMDPSRGIE